VQLDANLKALWDEVRFLRQRLVGGGTKVRTGELKSHADVAPKALRVAAVQSYQHCQVESGGKARSALAEEDITKY
jgi:hypothetical protein